MNKYRLPAISVFLTISVELVFHEEFKAEQSEGHFQAIHGGHLEQGEISGQLSACWVVRSYKRKVLLQNAAGKNNRIVLDQSNDITM